MSGLSEASTCFTHQPLSKSTLISGFPSKKRPLYEDLAISEIPEETSTVFATPELSLQRPRAGTFASVGSMSSVNADPEILWAPVADKHKHLSEFQTSSQLYTQALSQRFEESDTP